MIELKLEYLRLKDPEACHELPISRVVRGCSEFCQSGPGSVRL